MKSGGSAAVAAAPATTPTPPACSGHEDAGSIQPPGIGSIVNNRYLLESRLGHGCMGQVFVATDLAAESTGVADARIILEVVATDLYRQGDALNTLKDAVARARRLAHPNIARVFGVEQADRQVSVAMEFMSGRWLGDIIRQAKKNRCHWQAHGR